jgi:hypothetical protein
VVAKIDTKNPENVGAGLVCDWKTGVTGELAADISTEKSSSELLGSKSSGF